jgi:hypothetical protein
MKVTVPVADEGATVAVKVTDWPNVEGLSDEASDVVVAAWPTVWVNNAEALPLKLVSPLYTAVMLWLPTARVAVLKWPIPDLSVAVPKVAAPSMKVTVPVADEGATVAVKVTGWPNVDGLADERSDVVLAFFTVRVKLWVASGETPLLALKLNG